MSYLRAVSFCFDTNWVQPEIDVFLLKCQTWQVVIASLANPVYWAGVVLFAFGKVRYAFIAAINSFLLSMMLVGDTNMPFMLKLVYETWRGSFVLLPLACLFSFAARRELKNRFRIGPVQVVLTWNKKTGTYGHAIHAKKSKQVEDHEPENQAL